MDKYLNYDAKKAREIMNVSIIHSKSFQIRSRDYFLTIQNVFNERKKNDIHLALGKSVCCKEVHLLKLRAD